ncbi:MAG TPA: hypothetical protein VFY42_02135 [Gemmatimonadales bacterium]|nr:hypothetical protein [Gemmatimonadales bacterium]
MIRWLVWPRQYGKTHRLREWWLEDPEGRVILTDNDKVADNSRQLLAEALRDRYPARPDYRLQVFLRSRVMSFRAWLNLLERCPGDARRELLVAVDGAEHVLRELLKAPNIGAITGAGRNEEPDSEVAAWAAAHHERWARVHPPGIDWTVS